MQSVGYIAYVCIAPVVLSPDIDAQPYCIYLDWKEAQKLHLKQHIWHKNISLYILLNSAHTAGGINAFTQEL